MTQYHLRKESKKHNPIEEISMKNKLKIIFVYDDLKEINPIREALKKAKVYFEEMVVNSKKSFIKTLNEFPPSIILADPGNSTFTALEVLEILNKGAIKIPLILVSGHATVEEILEIIKAGASDYISSKQLKKLPKAIGSALEKCQADKERQEYITSLQATETRFRALIENTVDSVVILNTEGKVTYASPSIEKVLGYTEEEALQISIFDVVHPDDQPMIMAKIPECLEKPGVSLPVMQYRCKHKDTTWVWYEGTITNMLHDPAINGIVDNFHEITNKKSAEEELKQSEEKYRSFFENSLDAILLTVDDGSVIAANPAACKMFVMTEEEVGKAELTDLVCQHQELDKFLKEGNKNNNAKGQLCFKRKDGGVFLGEISVAILKDFKNTDRISMIIRDISERVKAEEALKISEERYRFLFEYSTSPKWIFDLENGKIVDVNDIAVKHYGYSREELLGMVTNDLKSPEELPRMAEIQKNLKNMEGLIRFGIFTQVKKDGTKIKAEVSGHKCFIKDKHCMVIDSFDVTERENALQELKESKEKLHAAQSIAKLGYWKLDLKTQEIYWSEMLREIVGVNKKTFKPTIENFRTIIHPEDMGEYEKFREASLNGLKDHEIEYRIIAKDGSTKWIHQNANIVRDDNGNTIAFEGIAQDVTAKKLLEISLEESHLRYKMVSKATSDVIWDWDFTKNKAYWGEGFETIFGYPLKEIEPLNDFWEQNIHPDDRDEVLQNIQKAIEGPQLNWMVEYRFRKADNTYAHVSDRAFFTRNSDGKATRLAGGMQDITERKELQELLDKANSLAKIGSYEMNFDTKGLYWNSIMKDIHEVPQDFNPSIEKIREFYHDEISKETIIQAFDNATRKGVPFDVEVRIITAKGNLRWVKVIGETESVEGKVSKIYGSIQDIDERKKNEEALRLSNERYHIVTKATNDSIWDWDLVENKVIRPGKTLESTLGYDNIKPDQVDDFWENHVQVDDWKRISENRRALFINPEENYWDDEYRFLKPDGSYAIIYDRAYISRNKAGKAIRMIGASRDITKIKESEIQLKALNETLEKRAKELVASNLELEQFAYVASHDLQEPLRMVTNFLTQIEKKYDDLLDEKGKTYIYFAVDGAKRMRQMILDLLEFSRAGRIENKYEQVNLDVLVRDILDLHQKKIKETKAVVNLEKLPIVDASKTAL
ncbi:MAG: PAS domain S-box protein, partial [Ginsengibacter sp.]